MKPLSELPRRIHLRLDPLEAAEKLGIPGSKKQKINRLQNLGVSQRGTFDRYELRKKLSRRIPPWLNLRGKEEKTVENCMTAIIGRIGDEKVFEPFNVQTDIKKRNVPRDEAVLITLFYLNQRRFSEPASVADTVARIAESVYPERPFLVEGFVTDVSELYG